MAEEKAIREFIEEIGEKEIGNGCKIDLKSISSGGANYSSILYTATVTRQGKTLSLFIKVAALSEKLRESMTIRIYDLEKYFYITMKNIFRGLEDKYKVAEKNRLALPKYYGSKLNYLNEMLVLENLVAKGFSAYDRIKSVSWPYAAATITELAKYHALTVSFRLEFKEEYETFLKNFNHPWMNEKFHALLWKSGYDTSVQSIKEEYKERLRIFLDGMDLKEVLRNYEPIKLKVIAHNDFRVSNILHRDKEDGSVEVIPVDYQTLLEGGPVPDLLYFIFTGTNQEFRRRHFKELVDHYYKELSEAMTRLGLDPHQIYSKEDFEIEFKERLPFGLTLASTFLQIVTVETEDAPDVKGEGLDLDKFAAVKTSEVFVQRINEIVEDYIEWGII